MSKTLKLSILLVIITLGFLFLGTEVKAVNVDSESAFLEALYEGNDTTITLTENVESNDIFEFCDKDYVIDLNGYNLTAGEMYLNDHSLTINDSKGGGKLSAKFGEFTLWVYEGAELIINNGEAISVYNEGNITVNNGKIQSLFNYGNTTIHNGTVSSLIDNSETMIINNGKFESIWNMGSLTINDGKFANISCDGGTLFIKGGTFTAYKFTEELEDGTTGEMDRFSMFNIKSSSITITGGEFKADGIKEALRIYGNNEYEISENSINDIIGKGYLAEYKLNQENCTSWEMSYSSVKINKDESEAILNKIAPNGVWKINGAKPTDWEESDFLLTAIAGDTEVPKGYEFFAFCEDENPFNPENVTLGVMYNNTPLKSINVKAVYNEPEKEVKDKVGSILDKIAEKTGESHKVETGFRLEDLYLINYLNVAKDGLNSSLALNFSKDLIALTNGGNITYKFDSRLGDSTPTGLWNYTGGRVIVYYDGMGVGTTEIGLTLNNVLYIPSDTAENQKIDAALARIKDYLGTIEGITITKGGTLESLNADGLTWNDYGFIDENTCGSNYYNVTIKGETYKFAICKKDSDKLETPKYVGTDVISKISVTSDDKTIPLDTAVSVKEVETDALGTDAYAAYDITLYSNAKEAKVTKLKNGKFIVSIPVPEKLKNIENLTVYYIDSKGNKEDYNATIKDGIATFETSHFSTYAIAEKEQKVEIYSLTLDANEGKFADGKAKLVFEDVTKCDMTKVEKPVRDGYTFKGWFTEKTGGKSIETVMSSEDGIKEDMIFYAQWEKIETENSGEGEEAIPQPPINEGEDNNNTGNTNTDNTNTNKPTGNNPQTGDDIVMFTVISLIALAGTAFAIKVKKYVK